MSSRWLHIYLSMVSFAILFFFAATGFTLNHADWFANEQKTVQFTGKVNRKWLSPGDNGKVAKLDIVEYLRDAHKIGGPVSDFRIDDSEIDISFKNAGFSADAAIDRASGEYQLTRTSMGLVGVINDLHKGRDTGAVWKSIIDVSAVLMIVVSLTGMFLIWFLQKKRFSGFLTAGIGALIFYFIYVIWVQSRT